MRDVTALIEEANRIASTQAVGDLTVADIFHGLVALEAASGAARRQALHEYRPAIPDDIKEFVESLPDINMTASAIYSAIYGREPSAAEARTAAQALRAIGLSAVRSNGKTMFRHVAF